MRTMVTGYINIIKTFLDNLTNFKILTLTFSWNLFYKIVM